MKQKIQGVPDDSPYTGAHKYIEEYLGVACPHHEGQQHEHDGGAQGKNGAKRRLYASKETAKGNADKIKQSITRDA